MTKRVRVENADGSTLHRLEVQLWEQLSTGPAKVETKLLESPCAMVEMLIHSGRWLVVKEVGGKPDDLSV